MSRLSQIIAFVNAEEIPSSEDMKHYYTDIEKTVELKRLRSIHLKKKRDEKFPKS